MKTDPENTLLMELPWGSVVIECLPDLAPRHVERMKQLAREGFFDGLPFHRAIESYVAQTGDPSYRGDWCRGTGEGGTGLKLKAEFSPEPHVRGIVSTARSDDPDSGDSQIFIMLADVPRLDGGYTVWGRVVEGMEHVDRIKTVPQGEGLKKTFMMKGKPVEVFGYIEDQDCIISMRVAADVNRTVKQEFSPKWGETGTGVPPRP